MQMNMFQKICSTITGFPTFSPVFHKRQIMLSRSNFLSTHLDILAIIYKESFMYLVNELISRGPGTF